MDTYMKGVGIYAITLVRRFFRDPVALFFTILFPLIFLFVFGTIFGGNNSTQFSVAIINNSKSEFAKTFVENAQKDSVFKVKPAKDEADARTMMKDGSLDSIIILPAAFGVANEKGPSGQAEVLYKKGDPQAGQTVGTIITSIFSGINQQITSAKPPFTVVQKAAETNGVKQFDYTFSGLVGFSIMSLGIFGLANQMPGDKKTGALRRLRVSPFKSSQLVLGTMLYYLIIGLISIAILTIVALLVFKLNMQGNWLNLIAVVSLGLIMMIGFGLAIGGWAKNENQSAPLANLVSFPMMFLSGAFFPRFAMPDWLRASTDYLPLTPVIDSIRYIMTENSALTELAPQLMVIGVWTIVIYFVAVKVFRWE